LLPALLGYLAYFSYKQNKQKTIAGMILSILFGMILILFNISIRFQTMSEAIKELRRALADPGTLSHRHVHEALEALRAFDETVCLIFKFTITHHKFDNHTGWSRSFL
jgi:hypothetical protein